MTTSNSDELVMLHVLFRHGDRTPDLTEMYPKDPYNDVSYFSDGFGQLTQQGKNREFKIGQSLRERYGEFLSSYRSNEVSAITTDYPRTKMSCLLVLAGLYPPRGKEVWNDHLNWQPAIYDYNPAGKDQLLGDPYFDCPIYKPLYEEFLRSEEVVALIKRRQDLYNYLELHTGLKMEIPRDPYFLQFVLNAEQNIGLKLPPWTDLIWPDKITDAAVDEYYVNLGTPKLKRLAGGMFAKKLLENIKEKLHNGLNPMKIYLYSAHEYNLAYQLILLDVFHRHVPPYGAYIVYEVRKINGEYGVMILYENYSKEGPKYLQIPGCGVFCPLKTFEKLLNKYVPLAEDFCENQN